MRINTTKKYEKFQVSLKKKTVLQTIKGLTHLQRDLDSRSLKWEAVAYPLHNQEIITKQQNAKLVQNLSVFS